MLEPAFAKLESEDTQHVRQQRSEKECIRQLRGSESDERSELTSFRGSCVEKEGWERTKTTAEEASHREMPWEMVADTPIIPDNPVGQDRQQVVWTLRGYITTMRVFVKKTAG